MCRTYAENPTNYDAFRSLFIMDIERIVNQIIQSSHVLFYDACSFRKHAGLNTNCKRRIIEYFIRNNTVIVLTRIILMELTLASGELNSACVSYLDQIVSSGVNILLLEEEYLYDVLSSCFSTNARINEYLIWAVRTNKSPVGTITKTLAQDNKLSDCVLKAKGINKSDIYSSFFARVRSNKESDDNLGEEVIGICVNILSHVPGIVDGKLVVLTEDKGAASHLYAAYKKTTMQYRGTRFELLSTPKMVQRMFQENGEITEQEMIEILAQGVEGNVVVMGTTACDYEVNPHISMSASELAKMIRTNKEISIIF